MVSCGPPGSADWADKSPSIITLVTIIIMLLQLLYHSIFRTLVYLMPETYSKPCQISKIMRYVKNHGNIQSCSGILRDIKAQWGIFRHYWVIILDLL